MIIKKKEGTSLIVNFGTDTTCCTKNNKQVCEEISCTYKQNSLATALV
jgi:hypothetical protein